MNRLQLLRNCIGELLNASIFICLEQVLFSCLLKTSMPVWGYLIAAAVALVLYGIREKVQNSILFFLLHILTVVLIVFFSRQQLSFMIIFGVFTFIQVCLSIAVRLHKKRFALNAMLPVAALGILTVLTGIDSLQTGGGLHGVIEGYGIAFIGGYFFYHFIGNFIYYIDINERTTGTIPVKSIWKSAVGLVTGFVILTLLLILLMANQTLAAGMGRFFRTVFVAFFTFLFSLLPSGVETEEIPVETGGAAAMEEFIPVATDNGVLARILDQLVAVFAAGIIIFIVILLGIGLYRLIHNAFLRNGKHLFKQPVSGDGDLIERLEKEDRKGIQETDNRDFHLFRTPAEKIRGIYKKTLWRKYQLRKEERTMKLLQHATARECCETLFGESSEQAVVFSSLYEKARYSAEECTTQDVRLIKKLSGELCR